jgi:hypothetical protein
MDTDKLESTNKLLKVIVGLLLRETSEERPRSLREQIDILHDLGLKPVEIAGIIGRTNTYVNKELSGIRASRRK